MLRGEKTYNYIGDVVSLNNEFEEIKNLLEYYLTDKIQNGFCFDNGYSDMVNFIDLFEYEYKDLEKNKLHPYFLEFPPNYRNEIINFDKSFRPLSSNPSKFDNLFLDFNYTPTVSNYVNVLNNKRL